MYYLKKKSSKSDVFIEIGIYIEKETVQILFAITNDSFVDFRRQYPPSPSICRQLEEDTVINGYNVSAGVSVFKYLKHEEP